MNIVIITHQIYPTLGPRSHRSSQLMIELARQGHHVVTYALLGKYDYTEYKKEGDIEVKNLGVSKWGLADSDGNYVYNLLTRIAHKVLGWLLFFPEITLVSMVKRVIKKEKNIDLLITIAHPHTIHWAVGLSNTRNFKCWVADCGDPLMGDPYERYPFYFKYIEKKWCRKADYISVPVETAINGYFPEFRKKIRVIPQGFRFDGQKIFDYKPNSRPTFLFSGVVYPGTRDPRKLLEYLSTINVDYHFIVYSKAYVFKEFSGILGDKLEIREYVPREELIYEMSKTDFLVNICNISQIQQPSKLIDYAQSTRPILDISTQFTDDDIKRLNEFFSKDYSHRLVFENIEDYNIVNVAHKFIDLVQ